VFENRVLRIIFGPKRDEVMGEWRKLHNEDVYIYKIQITVGMSQGQKYNINRDSSAIQSCKYMYIVYTRGPT
jgi:hypothetical protein